VTERPKTTLGSALKFGFGWAIVAAAVLPVLALRDSSPAGGVVIQLVAGAIAIGLGGYWSMSVSKTQAAAGWVLAFVLASCWFWVAPKSQASLQFQSSGGHAAQTFDDPATSFEHSRNVVIGPSNLVGAEIVFGFVGGVLATLAGAARTGLAVRSVLSGVGWAVGSVVGGYVAFVGSYLLALIGGALLRPVAPLGASLGFAAAGWLGGALASLIGQTAQGLGSLSNPRDLSA
jgi:hypothetical protein